MKKCRLCKKNMPISEKGIIQKKCKLGNLHFLRHLAPAHLRHGEKISSHFCILWISQDFSESQQQPRKFLFSGFLGIPQDFQLLLLGGVWTRGLSQIDFSLLSEIQPFGVRFHSSFFVSALRLLQVGNGAIQDHGSA